VGGVRLGAFKRLECFFRIFPGINDDQVLLEFNSVDIGDFTGLVRLAEGIHVLHFHLAVGITFVFLKKRTHTGVVLRGAQESERDFDGGFALLDFRGLEHVDALTGYFIALVFRQVPAVILVAAHVIQAYDDKEQQEKLDPGHPGAFDLAGGGLGGFRGRGGGVWCFAHR